MNKFKKVHFVYWNTRDQGTESVNEYILVIKFRSNWVLAIYQLADKMKETQLSTTGWLVGFCMTTLSNWTTPVRKEEGEETPEVEECFSYWENTNQHWFDGSAKHYHKFLLKYKQKAKGTQLKWECNRQKARKDDTNFEVNLKR